MTVQDVLDMIAAHIPTRDIEEILVQGYNFTREAALDLINQAAALWK